MSISLVARIFAEIGNLFMKTTFGGGAADFNLDIHFLIILKLNQI